MSNKKQKGREKASKRERVKGPTGALRKCEQAADGSVEERMGNESRVLLEEEKRRWAEGAGRRKKGVSG